jgi:hypothetical protein
MSTTLFQAIEVGDGYFAQAKAGQEALVFAALVREGSVNLDASAFEIARQLRVPLAKAKSLIYQHRIITEDANVSNEQLGSHVKLVQNSKSDDYITFSVEDAFYRQLLVEKFKKREIYSDTSFNSELLTVHASALPGVLEAISATAASTISKKVEALVRAKKVDSIKQLLWVLAQDYGPSVAQLLLGMALGK